MKQRIITAILILSVIIPAIYVGGVILDLIVVLLGLLAVREFLKLKKKIKKLPISVELMAYILTSVLIYEKANVINFYVDYRIILVLLMAFLFPVLLTKEYDIEDGLYLIAITIFISSAFNIFINIRNLSILYVIYLILITTITDSFALFTGKLIGKKKLNERISPNKTLEGFIGGSLMGTIAATTFYVVVINNNPNVIIILLLTLILTIVGQAGDLVFSAIKRHYKVKDFSNIFPGHGGVLDRLDSLIFVMFVFSLFLGVI